MGRQAFSVLRESLSPEVVAEAAALTEQMDRQLALTELQKTRPVAGDKRD